MNLCQAKMLYEMHMNVILKVQSIINNKNTNQGKSKIFLMDQIHLILVEESIENDHLVVRFMDNNQDYIPKIEIKLTENYSEVFSSVLYDNLDNKKDDECHYLYFNEPLKSLECMRFNLITQLSADVILKLLNLKYIPIIRTNYSNYKIEDIIQVGNKSVIEKLNQSWQTQCKLKSKITKDFISIVNDFKYYYRIDILLVSTLQQIKKEKYSSYDVLYVPTDELIQLKTGKRQQQISLSLQNLKKLNKLI
ncbi:unnamed protein product (macronuclear) [Paramecium tetraurelia]|uniref:Uncharacterized protein n=1 Tax=Paramecium tetraurelia TaxID=5888 RepID=A0DJN4_PARTE|nr:uncharacterized protein GSPATT00017595001 [Paramecium tetraurelia]CAK83251.1 unnamed protein product [Paramecium tetraurelia]|eukprot:XP_001450648.1 hypothetical protein (macronuclear) [Paramecium tetraurelia strain d4-2]